MLDVGEGHKMYYETHGNPRGRPIVCLHGGPGAGLQRFLLRLFNLKKWFVILYDQRGCGRSTPRLELKDNKTSYLIKDLETLREHLHLDSWALYGGSWGTTLALAYASKHLDRVTAFVLRGICLFTEEENAWMFEKGHASEVFPRVWENVTKPLKKGTRKIIRPYLTLLKNPKTRRSAATAWSKYEHVLSSVKPQPFQPDVRSDEESALLEAYYFAHNGWITPKMLLETAKKIQVPVLLVHGQFDMVCPASSAFLLKDAIPHAKLFVVAEEGHSMRQPGMLRALRKAIQSLVA
jgi:proline iminopeptidase